MNKYKIALYEDFHTIDTEEQFYKYLLRCYINRYHEHFIKSIRICKNFKRFLHKKYPQLAGHKLAELCYWFYNDLTDFPKCENEKCNNRITNFYKFFDAYNRFCSSSCSCYGTKQERYKTCIALYGKPNPNQFDSNDIKKRKYRQINVYHLFLNEEAIPLFSVDEYIEQNVSHVNNKKLRWKCTKCNMEFEAKAKFCNNRINGIVHHARCPYCYPLYNFSGKTVSIREKEVVQYIKSIYSGEVIENDRTMMVPDKQHNNWKKNHELDIVLPSLKLAFEFNGIYWHNPSKFPETTIDDNEKIRQCSNLGIELVFINERNWLDNRCFIQDLILKLIEKHSMI